LDTTQFVRIRDSLQEKRQALADWFAGARASEKQLRLGPAGEPGFIAHLQVIDQASEKSQAGTLGLCTVCHEPVNDELLVMDYTCCVCLDHLSGPELRRLEQDLELSADVQRALLAPSTPQVPGVEYAAFSRPAQYISGDYFDFVQFGDGAFGMTIADVAGHGIQASLMMASVQTALRTLAPENTSPAAVVERINYIYNHNLNFSSFVTLFLGRIDPAAGTLTYCNAGHNPPILLHDHGQDGRPGPATDWLAPTGSAIGLVEGSPFTAETIPFHAGDVLLLYTDGVTEARGPSGEFFGEQRLAELLAGLAGQPARPLLDALRGQLEAFLGGQPPADDVTLLVCKLQ
jgi:sigma-B regulation protein RsbU (phosphoserine phosphatase)